jgi:hypothetical protein
MVIVASSFFVSGAYKFPDAIKKSHSFTSAFATMAMVHQLLKWLTLFATTTKNSIP